MPGETHSVFIGYDVRHHSREFAEETAKVFAGNGIRVLLAKEICPTPLVSFACRYYKCSAAVMITASHNPPQYNGYKVYWSDGCQVVPPHDEGIMAEVEKIKSPDQVKMGDDLKKSVQKSIAAYLAELKKVAASSRVVRDPAKNRLYESCMAPAFGSFPKALKSWGYSHVSVGR